MAPPADLPPTGTPAEPDRHISLESALNFRDIGGYRGAQGRRVRWRRVFRAGGLSELSPADLDTVRALGVATVVDLRSTEEWTADRFPAHAYAVSHHHLPVVEQIFDPSRFDAPEGMLEVRYQEMATTGAGAIAQAIAVVADPATHPVVVHCAAGKDRTGIVVAVLLSLLGVADETVAEDYALSTLVAAALRAQAEARATAEDRALLSEALLDEVLSSRSSNITALLAMLRATYGSVEDYVVASGLKPDAIETLRASLLE